MTYKRVVFLILFPLCTIVGQYIPEYYLEYKTRKTSFDIGKAWEGLSTIGDIRFVINDDFKTKRTVSKTFISGGVQINAFENQFLFSGFSYMKYDNNYFAYISTPIKAFTSDKQNLSFDPFKAEEESSGFGYENNWLLLQFGKGNESWGSGDKIQLALNKKSSSYDYFLLRSDYGRIRVKYIHGFLETINNINRFITARAIEWTNKKSFIIGFSETVIYSGENRSIDIGYLNPISSHLEVELNDRLNVIGNKNSNAVWQMHIDFLYKKKLRLSANYLLDELVLDPDIQLNKENGKAASLRVAYTPLSKNHLITIYGYLIYVGTPTFRHGNGENNFVKDGRPLGWSGGSDGLELSFGINYFNKKNLFFSISTGFTVNGEESITQRVFEPYKDYLKGPFPSGAVNNSFYFKASSEYWLNKKYSLKALVQTSNNDFFINSIFSIPIIGF
ncbi:MAG: hypothetical protein CMG63_04800 [Candidatus Marinimicrobia bacterium]|nr:hypothetical protein [Candidatus Neomarinimicrobiota bacterium]